VCLNLSSLHVVRAGETAALRIPLLRETNFINFKTYRNHTDCRFIKTQQPALSIFSVGMIGLGVLALIYGDFALVWQPVPGWVPGRMVLAYTAGLVMLLGGLGLLFEKTTKWSIRVIFVYLILWLMLKVPPLFLRPQSELVWLGVGELAVLLAGGWVLFAGFADVSLDSRLAFAAGEQGTRVAKILFAIALIPIGLSHFIYPKDVADLVPIWLPFRIGWVYLTGSAHIAAGLGVLFSIFALTAAIAEAAMLSIFTLLVWVPAVVAAPRTRLPWTAFLMSWAITSGAWLIASSILQRRSVESGKILD
jgi:uncharacterized membrane protein